MPKHTTTAPTTASHTQWLPVATTTTVARGTDAIDV
jgi:hypothetical protein